METLAFKMKLSTGKEEEYKKRHDALWPELAALLHAHGISNYSIFLDHETLDLFGTMTISDKALLDQLPTHPVMKKWWAYMKDIMETNPDHSPVSISLERVFFFA